MILFDPEWFERCKLTLNFYPRNSWIRNGLSPAQSAMSWWCILVEMRWCFKMRPELGRNPTRFFLPKMNFKWNSNLVEVFEFVEDVDEVLRRSWCEIVTFRKLLLILFIFSFNFSVIVDRFAAALHLNRKFIFATGSDRRKQIKAFVK